MVYNRPQEEEKMFRESFKNTCIEQKKLQDGQMKRMLMPHSVFDLARSSWQNSRFSILILVFYLKFVVKESFFVNVVKKGT